MPKSTTFNGNAGDNNFLNPADWTNGVPAAGDTVSIPTGAPAANGVAIVGETISLSGSGTLNFDQTGSGTTSSFDANTTLTGTTDSSQLYTGIFTNAGAITNTNIEFPLGSLNNAIFTNAGTITFNRAPLTAPSYLIATDDPAGQFINNGTLNVSSPAGSQNNGTAAYPDSVNLNNALVGGTGTVNITGGFPNATSAMPSVSGGAQTQAALSLGAPTSSTGPGNTYNLNDGILTFQFGATGTVNFLDASSDLNLTLFPGNYAGLTVNGFRTGDYIGVASATGVTYNPATNIATLSDNNGRTETLRIVPTGGQVYTANSFSVGAIEPFTTGTALTVNAAAPCYCPGTAILTDRGDVAVEALAIGDRVITLDGSARPIRWIGHRSYEGRFVEGRTDVLPVCITANAFADGQPRRDLWVSPLHAMFISGCLVPAGALVNGVSVTQAESVGRVDYIHIELAEHGVIWAEGAASETFVDDGSRMMFHNARQFDALYPHAPRVAAAYCALRVEHGEMLDMVKRAIDARSGLRSFAAAIPLRGHLDSLDGLVLLGWAQNPANPEAPVCVELLVDGQVVDRGLATVFRKDLRGAGIGSGYHGFRLALPPGEYQGRIEVRRAGDGALVPTGGVRRAA